jgi:hypothetical protein
MAIWYSSWSMGIFFPVLVFCTEKNLATLVSTDFLNPETCWKQCVYVCASLNGWYIDAFISPVMNYEH